MSKPLKRLDLLYREVEDIHAQENFLRIKQYLDNFVGSGATGPQGPQGPPGQDGIDGTSVPYIEIEKIAGETISALKAVFADTSSQVKNSDYSVTGKQFCIGVSRTSATSGNPINIIIDGVLEDTSFSSFSLNEPVFVGTNGSLTQTPNTSGVLLEIGYYLGDNKIEIEIKRPIILV